MISKDKQLIIALLRAKAQLQSKEEKTTRDKVAIELAEEYEGYFNFFDRLEASQRELAKAIINLANQKARIEG